MTNSASSLSWTVSTAGFPDNPPTPTIEARHEVPESHSRFLHVVEQGATLRRAGSRVLVTHKQEVLLDVPAAKLQGVLIYGNVQVSSQCVRNLLDQGCWLSFLTRNGIYKGRLQPPCERGGKLRRLQYERSCDSVFSLGFAKAVVHGKLLSAKQVLSAYASNYLAATLGESHAVLRQSIARLPAVSEMDELRGVEGAAARAYFDLFRRCNRSQLPFEKRVKRGASDPINVLLNFGYTLVTRELEGLIESAGLDPTVGFYHAPDGDRPSLACDWVEEFRHTIVDRLVLKLVNLSSIQASGFDQIEDKGLRMKPETLRKFLAAYEQTLAARRGKQEKQKDGARLPYRSIFLAQLAGLLDAITSGTPYQTHLQD
jgi:CRISPR-associated protein Cas1